VKRGISHPLGLMPLHDSGDELSSRHLPDVSDNSFSFQIPGTVTTDNLLADVDLDFFRGADVSIAIPTASTPAATRATLVKEPLTLSQLTPRPTSEKEMKIRPPKSMLPIPPSISQPTVAIIPKEDVPQPSNHLQRPALKLNITNAAEATKKATTRNFDFDAVQDSPRVRLDNLKIEMDALPKLPPLETAATIPEPAKDHAKPKGIRRQSLEKKETVTREERRERHGGRSKQVCHSDRTLARMKYSFNAPDRKSLKEASPRFGKREPLSQLR